MPASDEPVLDTTHSAFIQSGVGMAIAASTRDAIPVHVRAMGSRVSADRRQVTVFVSSPQAEPVLQCIRDNAKVAVVFTDPLTHRTMQLKGRDAQAGPPEAADHAIIDAYRTAFARALAPLGFEKEPIHTLLSCSPADIVGIRFNPTEAFSQTPGPNAGERLARTP